MFGSESSESCSKYWLFLGVVLLVAGEASSGLVRLDCLHGVSFVGESARFPGVTAGEDATCVEAERRIILVRWGNRVMQIEADAM